MLLYVEDCLKDMEIKPTPFPCIPVVQLRAISRYAFKNAYLEINMALMILAEVQST